MNFRDAVLLIGYRAYLSDLDAALALVGYRLAPLVEETVDAAEMETEMELDAKQELLRRAIHRRRVRDSRRNFADRDNAAAARNTQGHSHLDWKWGPGVVRLSAAGDWADRPESKVNSFVSSVLPVQSSSASPSTPQSSQAVPLDTVGPSNRPALPSEVRLSPNQLSGVLCHLRPGRRLDVERVVSRLARGQAVTQLPMLPRLRAAQRLDLVVDIGLMSGPFGHDILALQRQIVRAVPDATVRRLAYSGLLSLGCGEGPMWRWTPYRYPSAPTATVFLTGGFGIEQSVRRRELEIVMAGLRARPDQAVHGYWLGSFPDADVRARTGQWTVLG